MYALYSEKTQKIEAVGKTLKKAYDSLPAVRSKDPIVVINPSEYKQLENEAKQQKRGHGPHNFIDFSKLEKKESISPAYSGFGIGLGK